MEEEERLTRIERAIDHLAERTNHLDEVMVILAESHIKLVKNLDRIALESEERDRRLGERLDQATHVSEERDRRLGERIEALVSAMGAFISRLNPGVSGRG
jgi:predicted  nucleic acid-binding Zn-ribbon protein